MIADVQRERVYSLRPADRATVIAGLIKLGVEPFYQYESLNSVSH